MTVDVDAGLLQPPDAAAVRERDDAHVVAVRVEAGHERVDVLLRAAVRAGGHDLHDPHATAVDRLAVDLVERRARRISRSAPIAIEPPAAAVRWTSRRSIGSSTAPHSYL